MEIAGSGKALTKLKEQAEHNAFKRLQSQFSSPEQLEQIDQHILGNEKRKVNNPYVRTRGVRKIS